MSILQFAGYLIVQLIFTGAITFTGLLAVFHLHDWWANR